MFNISSWYQADAPRHFVQLLEVKPLRREYLSKIGRELTKICVGNIPWKDDLENALEWLIAETISQQLRCQIHRHFASELGKTILENLPSIRLDVEQVFEPIFDRVGRRTIKMIRLMMVDDLLFVAVELPALTPNKFREGV